MTVQPNPTELQELALAQYAQTTTLRNAAVIAALGYWMQTDEDSIAASFLSNTLGKLLAVITGGQIGVSKLSEDYVLKSLRAQELKVKTVARVEPKGFAMASDGRSLETLLVQPVIETKYRISRGVEPRRAMEEAKFSLERIVSTQIMDAARMSTQVALVTVEPETGAKLPGIDPEVRSEVRAFVRADTAQPLPDLKLTGSSAKNAKLDKFGNPVGGRFGYVRMLNLPSCARCALLAGRWYGWTAGFKRHDNCDCIHIPCLLANPDVPNLITDPLSYFESLSFADQKKYFGAAATQALLDGADVYQVVNATSRKGAVYTAGGKKYTNEASSRRGIYGGRNRGKPRLTPEQIFKDTGNDRIEAVRLLKKYGYIVS